jgi:hypothetical protein
VTDWTLIFLGIIALATLTTAVVQVAVLLAASRAAGRLERLAEQFEQDIRPLLGHLNAIGRDASRAASLAAAQVERADQLFADLTQRVEQTMQTIQGAVGGTAREGAAVLAGLRAALTVLRETRARRARSRADDEDALFI